MKEFVLIWLGLAVASVVSAQSREGITTQADSSYTISSAWASIVKNYPEAKQVPELHSPAVKEKRNITYTVLYSGQGKRKLLLDAFYPKQINASPRAAILLIHGGGWSSGNKTLHHPLAQRLAALGYVCFTPEYRLSTEALFPVAIYDLKAALRWVNRNAKKYNIDPSKIVVAGHSAGGELAAFIGSTNGNPAYEGNGSHTKYSSKADAVIDIDGILAFIHPESGEGDDSKKKSAATNWFGYSKTENPALWREASPLTHAGKQSPPTLFINSQVERMHAGREDYIRILTANGIYSEVKTFSNAPHSFCFFEPWFGPMINYIDAFLKKIFIK